MYTGGADYNGKNSGANTPKEALNKGFIEDDDYICDGEQSSPLSPRCDLARELLMQIANMNIK